MSGPKGGKTETEQVNRVSPFQEVTGMRNMMRADDISQTGPIRNYGPTVAAFNDMQKSGFQNTADAASAFGLQAPTDAMAGMPAAQDFGGGMMGYSAAPVVDQSLAALEEQAPGQVAAMNARFIDPQTGAAPTNAAFQTLTPGIVQKILDDYEKFRIA